MKLGSSRRKRSRSALSAEPSPRATTTIAWPEPLVGYADRHRLARLAARHHRLLDLGRADAITGRS